MTDIDCYRNGAMVGDQYFVSLESPTAVIC
jgi:hypothetical protein